jgi:hypothetical protein
MMNKKQTKANLRILVLKNYFNFQLNIKRNISIVFKYIFLYF